MKKTTFLSFLMVLLSLTIASCSSNNLEKACEEANKQCPMMIEQGLTAQSIEYIGGDVVYTYIVDENYYSVKDMEAYKSSIKSEVQRAMSTSTDKNVKEMIKLCKEEGASLVYKYVGSLSNDEFEFQINPDEL